MAFCENCGTDLSSPDGGVSPFCTSCGTSTAPADVPVAPGGPSAVIPPPNTPASSLRRIAPVLIAVAALLFVPQLAPLAIAFGIGMWIRSRRQSPWGRGVAIVGGVMVTIYVLIAIGFVVFMLFVFAASSSGN